MPKKEIPSGVIVHVHGKRWMDEDGMKFWIDKIWHRCPGGLLKKYSCFVYDMFKTHMMESIKKKLQNLNTDVAIIPGVLTYQL